MATVRYIVSDVNQATTFYTTYLGFTLDQQMGSAFARIRKGNLELWLSGPESSASRAMPDGRQPQPGGWNRLVIEVEDIVGLIKKLKHAGILFRNDIVVGPGGKQTVLEDPSGNPIELFEPARTDI
ncbi:MAG: VOC family protein [bacterium]|nr:VOC family protein [bacterium]